MAATWIGVCVVGVMLHTLRTAASQCESNHCENPRDADTDSLLQRTKKQELKSGVNDAGAGRSDVGLAVSGGGQGAESTAQGLLAGMLAITSSKKMAEFMSNISAISGNSGGAIFTGEFIGSPGFTATLEDMAADPSAGAEIFNREWAARLSIQPNNASGDQMATRFGMEACCNSAIGGQCGMQGWFTGESELVEKNGLEFCCPASMLHGCQKSGWIGFTIGCGYGFYGLPQGHTVNGTYYCCPENVTLASLEESLREPTCTIDDIDHDFLDSVANLPWRTIGANFAEMAEGVFTGATRLAMQDDLFDPAGTGVWGMWMNRRNDWDPEAPLSDPKVPWANGKSVFFQAVAVIPTKSDDADHLDYQILADIHTQAETEFYLRDVFLISGVPQHSPFNCTGGLCGAILPIRYSGVMGSSGGGGGTAALPLGSAALKELLQGNLHYYSQQLLTWDGHPPMSGDASVSPAGGLSIWDDVSAASTRVAVGSSAGMAASINYLANDLAARRLDDYTIGRPVGNWLRKTLAWMSMGQALGPVGNASWQTAYQTYLDLVQNQDTTPDDWAAKEVIAVSDGGQIDNSAIASLVLAGYTKIIHLDWLNTAANVSGQPLTDEEMVNPSRLYQLLTQEQPCSWLEACMPMFRETFTDLVSQMSRAAVSTVAPREGSHCLGVYVAPITLHTIDSPVWGTTAGTEVNVLTVGGRTNGGLFQLFGANPTQSFTVGVYVGELARVLSQSPHLLDMIRNFLA